MFFARKFAAYLRSWSGCRARPSRARPPIVRLERGERRQLCRWHSLLLILGPIELVVLVPSLGAAV